MPTDFMALFDGNHAAVGTEEGGCLRWPDQLPMLADVWWECMVKDHLTGEHSPIGVYPMVHSDAGWQVKWGCVDFDEGETQSLVYARNVANALKAMGVQGWIERSRSKGYHVWVFAEEWVPADLMREALLGVCQVVDAPTREINPKSSGFDNPATLGNYVRIMYPGGLHGTLDNDQGGTGLAGGTGGGGGQFLHQPTLKSSPQLHQVLPANDGPGRGSSGQGVDIIGWCGSCGSEIHGVTSPRSDDHSREGMPRRVAIDPETQSPFCLSCFIDRAMAYSTPTERLRDLRALYEPPRPRQIVAPASTLNGDPVRRMSGLAYTVFNDGPREGLGRGVAIYKLACLLAEGGRHTFSEALELCVDADLRWGKFHERPNGEAQVERIVEKAFGY